MRKLLACTALIGLVAPTFGAWFDNPAAVRVVPVAAQGSAEVSPNGLAQNGSTLVVNLGGTAGPALASVAELTDACVAAPAVRRPFANMTDGFGSGWKGAAVSADCGWAFLGSGSGASLCAVSTEGEVWVKGANAKEIALDAPADALAFGTGGTYLYVNATSGGDLARWTVGADGTLSARVAKTTSATPVRALAVGRVGAKELAFYGDANGALYAMDVTDADSANWEETALGVAAPHPLAALRLSNADSTAPLLHALAENGEIAVYRLAEDGLSVAETAKTLSAGDVSALTGGTCRGLEVSADGKKAFLLSKKDARTANLSVVATEGYLESVTKNGINTGYYINAKTKIEIDFQMTTNALALDYQMRLFGQNGNGCGNYAVVYFGNATRDFKLGYGNAFNGVDLAPSDQKRHTIVYDSPNNVCTFATGGQVTKTVALTAAHDNTAKFPMFLFCENLNANGTSRDAWAFMRLYGCRVYEDGALVKNYVPCRRAGVAGLYESVEGEFLASPERTHAVSHDFVAGGDVPDVPDDPYVETDGEHGINAGVYLEPGIRAELDYAMIDWADPIPTDPTFHYQQRLIGGDMADPKISMYITTGCEYGLSVGNHWQATATGIKPDTFRHRVVLDGKTGAREFHTGHTLNNAWTIGTNVVTKFSRYPIILAGLAKNTPFTEFAPNKCAKMKIYGAKFYKNGVLVSDLVPRVQGGVAGLRNRVTGDFITATGLTAGGDETGLAATDEGLGDPSLESNGADGGFINSRFYATDKSKIEVDFALSSGLALQLQARVIGNDNYKELRRRNSVYINGSGGITLAHGDGTFRNEWKYIMADSLRHTATLDFKGRKKIYTTAGVTNILIDIDANDLATNFVLAARAPTLIFGSSDYNYGTSGLRGALRAKARLYRARFWEDDVLVHDYRPCIRGGVPGLKDAVDGAFVTSENVAALTAHDVTDIEEEDPALVITGNNQDIGKRYLDTGYHFTAKTKCVVNYALSENYTGARSGNGDWYLFSGRDANGILFCAGFSKNGSFLYPTSKWLSYPTVAVPTTAKDIRRTASIDLPAAQASFVTAGFTNSVCAFTPTNATLASGHTIKIAARYDGNNSTPMKIYGVKIYEGDTLMRDYSPVYYGGQMRLKDAVAGGVIGVQNYSAANVTGSGPIDYPHELKASSRENDAYIESDGNQIINTGYYVKPTSRIEVDYQLTSVTSQARVFGEATGPMSAELYVQGGLTIAYGVGDTWTCYSTGKNASTDRHIGYLDVNRKAWFSSLTGAHNTINAACTKTADIALTIFGKNMANTNSYGSLAKMRLYSFRIYESDVLIHEYLPYKKGDVIGLYDTVTGKVLTDALTSGKPFVYGGEGYGRSSGTKLSVLQAPSDKQIGYGTSATLSAYAVGAVGYRWTMNGEEIVGANGSTLTVQWQRHRRPAGATDDSYLDDVYTVTPIFMVEGVETPGETATAVVTSGKRGLTILIR